MQIMDNVMPDRYEGLDVCVCCGKPVPEGRMICIACELGISPEPAKQKEDRKN